MPSVEFRPCPDVYLLTASRQAFTVRRSDDRLDAFECIEADLRAEGLEPRRIYAPEEPSDIAALVAALPLELMARSRPRIAAFIYWFEHWEGSRDAQGQLRFQGINVANSVIRNVLIQRFRGIPFLSINVNASYLAGKWGVYLDRDGRQDELSKARSYKPALSESSYFAWKLGVAIRELNQGMLLSPFPEQLRRPQGDSTRQVEYDRLLEGARRLSCQSDTLARVLAQAFPEGEPVEILKCMGGLSGALVFVARTCDSAPKLVKLCDWHAAQSEYEGARFVIGPRLTNFAAVTITPGNDTGPSLFTEVSGTGPRDLGLLVYSIVGTPGGELTIRGLHDLVGDLRADPARVETLLPRLDSTLRQVLGQLHGERPRTTRRTLWGWLGTYLPPLYRIDLDVAGEPRTLPDYGALGFKPDSATLLAAADWRALAEGDLIVLEGALVTEIDEDSITVAHPDLGFRLVCRGQITDCLKGADYLKIGHPVRVRGRIGLEPAEWAESLKDEAPRALLVPRDWAAASGLPFALTYKGRAGAIHGDLNLNNLQFSDATPLGWLIDFDRSDADGMVAFDFAKLEVEIHGHHLIPEVHRLGELFPRLIRSTREAPVAERLLDSVLLALDHFSGQPRDILPLWQTLAREARLPIDRFAPGSLAHLESILCVLAVVRARANRLLRPDIALGEPPADLALALSCYALIAIKFAGRRGRLERAPYLERISRHYTSYWHLGTEPDRSNDAIDLDLLCRRKTPADLRAIDRYLYAATRNQGPVATILTAVRGRSEPLGWGPERQVWDVSSTGCVANISPLVGYLWLMARRKTDTSIIVPKIASRGTSCGTVDILEAGGYRFPDTPQRIRQAIERAGGVLCRQSEEMVRVDRLTMSRRKTRNLMKNPRLVWASVLAKKTLMGCTHAVIDVKLGRDTKLILDDCRQINETLCASRQRLHGLLPNPEVRSVLIEALHRLQEASVMDQASELLRYRAEGGLAGSSVRDLRILCTSADVPQGRAIGRLLILHQLDRALNSTDPFGGWPAAYRTFYLETLKHACDVPEDTGAVALKDAWKALKQDLPIFDSGHEYGELLSAISDFLSAMDRSPDHDGSRSAPSPPARPLLPDRAREDDVHVLTFGPPGAGLVTFIDAYALDDLFEALCGKDPYDPVVGFWLHRLPGERAVREAPFLTVFFRPGVMPERMLRHRIAGFFDESVELEGEEDRA